MYNVLKISLSIKQYNSSSQRNIGIQSLSKRQYAPSHLIQ